MNYALSPSTRAKHLPCCPRIAMLSSRGERIHEVVYVPGMPVVPLSTHMLNWAYFPTPNHKADVAQLVEQPIRNRQVIGSSPIVGSSFSEAYRSVHRNLLYMQSSVRAASSRESLTGLSVSSSRTRTVCSHETRFHSVLLCRPFVPLRVPHEQAEENREFRW